MQIKSVSTSRSESSWQKTETSSKALKTGNTIQSKETPFGHILFFIRQNINTLSFVLSVCYFGKFNRNIIQPHIDFYQICITLNQFLQFSSVTAYWNLLKGGSTKPISGQCPHFIPPENDRKPKVFWCFQGDKMRTLARNGLSLFISLYNINVTKVMFWVRI